MPICHDPPASITEELDFDKFMDEILVSETKETKEEKPEERPIKKMISENGEKVGNKIRFVRK